MVAAVDSDTLYILATGVSIVSIVVAVVAKLWFGKRASDEEEDEEEEPAENEEELQEQLARGNFGRVPSEEWRLHKKALDLVSGAGVGRRSEGLSLGSGWALRGHGSCWLLWVWLSP